MASKFSAFWNHPAGPKTIHFWAPTFKWALVLAGIADLNRPIENVSTAQSFALGSTGAIWARYATQITPVNYNLLACNVFVGLTGFYQLVRKFRHSMEQKKLHLAAPNPMLAEEKDVN